MQTNPYTANHVIVRHAHGLSCPRCRSPVYRVPRRLVDLLLSRFQPLRRYRCRSLFCSWIGNVHTSRADPMKPRHRDSYSHRRCRLEPSTTGTPIATPNGTAAGPPSISR